ncbi:flippase [Halalkalicoccus sp. NIPERK01]|uniref:flippase n=1 Tax=Halalkalicoccus sp. NIPERK01 TaxID=3053469 RepID=UPI00256EC15E|nr:flippase [Halalkalicoccus sp. NIPERK01]MDL5360615.1 flippase [Halalkalicoccus sp. NIPERK01]
MSVSQKIIGGLKAQLVSEGVRVVANGLVIVLLAREFLSPEEYGLLFLAISVFGVALLFSQFGIAKSAARYVAEYREKDPGQVPHIVRTSLLYLVVSILLVGGTITLFHDRIAALIGEPALASLLVFGLGYIAFETLRTYLSHVLQGFNRIALSAAVGIVGNVGLITFILLFLALGGGAVGALLGYIVGYGLACAAGLVIVFRLVGGYERASEVGHDLPRRILEYSVPLTATGGANVLYKQADTILIGVFLTPVAVGYYTLAKQIADFVIAPASSLGFTVAPTYGEHKASGDSASAARIYETTFEYVVLLYIPAAAGLVIVAEPTIRFVFGADYLGAVPVMQVLSGFVVLQAIDKITNDGLDFLGRARARAISKGSTAVLNFLLNLLLIPWIGVVGAAISTVFGFTIMVLFNVYIIHRELGLSIPRLARSVGLVCLVTAGMCGVVLFFLPYITNVFWLFAIVGLGGLVWLTLSALCGLLDVREAVSALR